MTPEVAELSVVDVFVRLGEVGEEPHGMLPLCTG